MCAKCYTQFDLLVMETSTGGKMRSRVTVLASGAEMLLLLDWQVRDTPAPGTVSPSTVTGPSTPDCELLVFCGKDPSKKENLSRAVLLFRE